MGEDETLWLDDVGLVQVEASLVYGASWANHDSGRAADPEAEPGWTGRGGLQVDYHHRDQSLAGAAL